MYTNYRWHGLPASHLHLLICNPLTRPTSILQGLNIAAYIVLNVFSFYTSNKIIWISCQ